MSRPAPAWRATLALAAMELRLALRRGENLLVTIVVPAVILVFFASVAILPTPGRPVDFLVPGALALAVMATGLVSLGIATAYERYYGVLKRLGGSPLPRTGLIAAKVLVVLAIEIVQIALLIAIAAGLLGWRPGLAWSPPLFAVALLLGTLAFAGLGLALAGLLRAEAMLAFANGLFLALLLLGGIVLPVDHLPDAIAAVARLLPAAALADLFRTALGQAGDPGPSVALLAAWAVGSVAAAILTFRWE